MHLVSADTDNVRYPKTPDPINPEDFTFKRALGLSPHILLKGISYLGVVLIDNDLIRSGGGTANQRALKRMTSKYQSLIWCRDKHIIFPPEAIHSDVFVPLHELRYTAPLKAGLKPIRHHETHGIFPASPGYLNKYSNLPFIYKKDGIVKCTAGEVQYANEGLKRVFNHMLDQATEHGHNYAAMDVLKEKFDHNPFSGSPQPLN